MKHSKPDLVLFDMDGTLTPPRMKITGSVEKAVFRLGKVAKVGIVSGSDFDYMLEQLGALSNPLAASSNSLGNGFIENLVLLPCNGTKMYVPTDNGKDWETSFSIDMFDFLGYEATRKIFSSILKMQDRMTNIYHILPFRGTFIQGRGSMLNWSIIGRAARKKERDAFIHLDKKLEIRKGAIEFMSSQFPDVTFKMGGDTSIDIYPAGWDKTFALRHFPDRKVWFVGDRCTGSGNDKELFDKLSLESRAFKTSGPDETIEIIDKIINTIK